MSINKKIRLAKEHDSEALLEIYGPFIKNTAVTFEYEVPTDIEFGKRIKSVLERHPWLVCEIDGEVIGYAYASKHRERAAYQWSVDVTVYIRPEYHRKCIATALYTALTGLLKLQGYYNAYAGIALPNVKSVGFHESFGFKPIGIYHNVGYKLDKWHDVGWFALNISECSKPPEPPKTINQIKDTKEYEQIVENAVQIIKD
jgi:L-amino acid N-acyltransferase YncA